MRVTYAVGFLAVCATSHATLLYSSMTPTSYYNYVTAYPRHLIGDSFHLASIQPGQHYVLNGVTVPVYYEQAGNYHVTLVLKMYGNYNSGATGSDPVFSDLLSTDSITYDHHAGANNVYDNMTIGNAYDTILQDGQVGGFTVEIFNNSQPDQRVGLCVSNWAPIQGTSATYGYYDDFDLDGTLSGNEVWATSGWSDFNIGVLIYGTAVPEPLSLVVLGAGSFLALRRRRRG